MKELMLKLCVNLQTLLREEDGQDLVEYALIACMIALGCAAGLSSIATAINQAFFTNATNIVNAAFKN